MKRLLVFAAVFLLASCAVLTPVTGGETVVPGEAAPLTNDSEDWAAAFADALLAHKETSSVTLMDIDRDGVPEAVETEIRGNGGVSRIHGFMNGQCAVWYDAETAEALLQHITFRQVNDNIKCVATYIAGRNGLIQNSVYELVKGEGVSGEPQIIPMVLSETICSYSLDLMNQSYAEIEAVTEAQAALYEKTISALGDEALTNMLTVNLSDVPYDRETLTIKLREWNP